ncbi:MAG: ABC transporter ATP-binding protein, partial [Acidimicrobiales bacterium]
VGLAWTLGKVSVPQLTRLAIDRGIEKNGSLVFWTLLIMGAAVVAGVFAAWRRYIAFRESRLTETMLRERLFSHIQGLHVGFHDRAQTGQLMSRSSSDLQQVQGFVVNIPIFVSQITMVLGVVVILMLSDPILALVSLAPLPFINVSARRFSHRIHPVVIAVQQEQAQLANIVEESVSGIRVVKGFGAESVQQKRLEHEADDIRRESMVAARIRSRFLPAIDLLPSLGLVAVLGLGGHRVINGDMTLGGLVAFNTYLTMLIWPMRNIGMTVAMGQRAATALTRVNEILSEQPAIASPPRPRHLPAAAIARPVGAVEFARVRFGYDLGHTDVRVLENLDWSIAPGESVAVVGATGSGKSTLARLLLRFYDPQSGAVMLDGVDLREMNLRELRRAVGVVFEDTLLFNDTVSANIAFARPDVGTEIIERAARLAGAHDFVLQLPDGYDTTLGERGYSLSGGQRQRIAIARAIVADPRVLVLDDATSAVDPTKEHEIRDALATVMRGRTTIVIAHRPATIELADRAVLLDGGRIAASGSHRELLDTNARYREVLAAMTEKSGADAGEVAP